MIAEPRTKPFEVQDAERLLDRLAEITKVDAVFGLPIEREGATLITCSELGIGLGGGVGTAKPTDSSKQPEGEGVGGAAVARGRPVAVIVMTHDGVKVKPIVNVTRMALTQVAMMGFVFLLTSRLLRHNRRTLRMKLARHGAPLPPPKKV